MNLKNRKRKKIFDPESDLLEIPGRSCSAVCRIVCQRQMPYWWSARQSEQHNGHKESFKGLKIRWLRNFGRFTHSTWNDSLGGGCFKYVLCWPLLGEMIQFDQYFSDGLKPPTSWNFMSSCDKKLGERWWKSLALWICWMILVEVLVGHKELTRKKTLRMNKKHLFNQSKPFYFGLRLMIVWLQYDGIIIDFTCIHLFEDVPRIGVLPPCWVATSQGEPLIPRVFHVIFFQAARRCVLCGCQGKDGLDFATKVGDVCCVVIRWAPTSHNPL